MSRSTRRTAAAVGLSLRFVRNLVIMIALAMLVGFGGMQLGFAEEPSRMFHSVTIQGEFDVKPGSICTYFADVSGGSGSYTYEWTLGNSSNIIGTGPSVNVTIPSGSHIGLAVTVWDGEVEAEDGRMIIPNISGSECDS